MSINHSYQRVVRSPEDRRLGPMLRLFEGLVRAWRRRRMIQVFEAMDDRLLRDIGFERSDITSRVAAFDDRELRMVPLSPSLGAEQQAA